VRFRGQLAKAVVEFYRQIKDEFLAGHPDADRVFEDLKEYLDRNWLCVAPSVYCTHTVRKSRGNAPKMHVLES
jgi:hypothetical protein